VAIFSQNYVNVAKAEKLAKKKLRFTREKQTESLSGKEN